MKVKNTFLLAMICIYAFILPIAPISFSLFHRSIKMDYFLIIIYAFYAFELFSKDTRERFVKGIKNFFTEPFSLCMVVLMLIMLFSTFYATEKKLALEESFRFLTYILLFFIVKYEVRDKIKYKLVLAAYIFSAFVVAAWGIIGFIFKFNVQSVYDELRAESFLGNSNSLAAFLVLSLFPVLMLIIFERKKAGILYGVVGMTILSAIVLTGSRNAFVACIIGCVILCLVYSWKLIIPLIPLGTLMMLIPKVSRRLGELFSSKQDESRIKLWQTAIAMIKEHPILGVGNGNFVSRYDYYVKRYPELLYPDYHRFPAHSSFLKIESELGIIGIVSFLGALITGLLSVKKFAVNEKDKYFKAFFLGLFASMIAFYFMNISDNLFFVPKITTYFWLLIAIQQGIVYNEKEFSV